MEVLAFLIPVALFLGLVGLGAFIWALKTGQFEDLDGAAMRILIDDDDTVRPLNHHETEDDQGSRPKQNVDRERELK